MMLKSIVVMLFPLVLFAQFKMQFSDAKGVTGLPPIEFSEQFKMQLGDAKWLKFSILDKHKWAFPTFASGDNLYISYSQFGKSDWESATLAYDSPYSLRDPSFMQLNDTFYCAFSKDAFIHGNSKFGIIKSTNLTTWFEKEDVDLSLPDVEYVWAPEWYVDGDKKYIVVNCKVGDGIEGNYTDFQSYIIECVDIKSGVWGEAIKLNIMGKGNIIDTYLIKHGGIYYAFYKDEDTKYIERAESTELYGEFTVTREGNWAGWYDGVNWSEGQSIFYLKNKWIIYMDKYRYENPSWIHGLYFSESYDMESWTIPMKTNKSFRHGTPFRFNPKTNKLIKE